MKLDRATGIHRLGIYFIYDKDGVVDNYIPYLLEDLAQNLDELMVVSNGPLSPKGREKLERITSHILERENKGLDVWAYKAGLDSYGWKILSQYDEVILLNFTIMGPIYPFREMFEAMAERDLDFWGVTRHYGLDYDPFNKCKYGYIPMHIQSSFMVFRSSLIKSASFQKYWDNMPKITDYTESICFHEVIFTKDFERLGFKSGTYVDTDDLADYHPYPLMLYPRELVENRRCPIFKRKVFYNQYEEFLDVSCGQAANEFYTYLREHTSYDVNMIWDTLLRTANMADIKDRMQLNYVVPSKGLLTQPMKRLKVALFLHIYYMDEARKCLHYARSMPEDADIYLTTDSLEKLECLREIFAELKPRKLTYLIVKNRGREMSAHFIDLRQYAEEYDLICFAHDKKTNFLKPLMIGEAFAYHCFENVLGSPDLVENVITTFYNNPRLGLLVPPTPMHGPFYSVLGNEWQQNFDNVKSLAASLNISVEISNNKAPIAPLGGIYWYRPDALKRVFKAKISREDYPEEPIQQTDGTIMHALERVLPFAAQADGYYSAFVLSSNFTRYQITNFNKYLSDINKVLLWKYGNESRYYYLQQISTPV